jgi:lactate dehydrogenase-like 2-hydroxyacid dehydrogenase
MMCGKRITCSQTKAAQAIITNAIFSWAMEEVLKDLNGVKFISLLGDSSNHTDLKLAGFNKILLTGVHTLDLGARGLSDSVDGSWRD